MRPGIDAAPRTFIALFAGLALAGPIQAATITVTHGGDGGGGSCPGAACTLRGAILSAAAADTIDFAPYIALVSLTAGPLTIDKALTIRGPAANRLTIRRLPGTSPFGVFEVVPGGFSTVVFSGLTITGGSAINGGGIWTAAGSRVAINDCAITGNSASNKGGGVFLESTGIFSFSEATIARSTISGNSAQMSGGGIDSEGGSLVTIVDSTIAGNAATDAMTGTGGGIYWQGSTFNNASGSIANSTIAGNSAKSGGGVYAAIPTTLRVGNSIIAKNSATSGPDYLGGLVSQGFNLIGNKSGTSYTPTTGDQGNVDPLLDTLQDNGGPTLTMALLPSSPAIDKGNAGSSKMDQRGFARPVDSPVLANAGGGDGSDIGAYEAQGIQLPGCGNTTVTRNDDAGTGSLRSVIVNLCAGETITFDAGVTSPITLTSGALLLDKWMMAIAGPSNTMITVQRSVAPGTPKFRIFDVLSTANARISRLGIANGAVDNENGGGVRVRSGGQLRLIDSTLSGNVAANGGGLSNSGTTWVTSSTVSDNHAACGGGIHNAGGLSVATSTVAQNSATTCGGGLYAEGGSVDLTSTTIAGNSGGQGGGVRNASATVSTRNTLVAGNTTTSSDPDFSGTLNSLGYNLVGDTIGTTIVGTTTGNQLGVDPHLDALNSNGGPTQTMALLAGSPAIDAGHSGGALTDQRGFVRPVDSPAVANAGGSDGSDIGAYEVQAGQLPGCDNTIVTTNADAGPGSLRDAIVNQCFAGATITFAPGVASPITLTSGELLFGKTGAISGPGAHLMTVQRNPAAATPSFRVFNVAPGAVAAISDLTIAHGSLDEADSGAGVFVPSGATLTLAGVTLNANGSNKRGGALANGGSTLIVRSAIHGNGAFECGGGLSNGSGGTLSVFDTTIANNSGTTSGGGLCNEGGTTTLTNTTIAGNSTDEFGTTGGVISALGTVTVRNTLIANNSGPNPNIFGTLHSQGFNLIGISDGGVLTPADATDQIGDSGTPIDPLLGPLQYNGGPTQTLALLPGSPALDKGHSSSSATDQRGFGRPNDIAALPNPNGGDGADVGAYEHRDVRLDADADNAYDPLTDGVLIVRYLLGITGSPLTAGALGTQATRTLPAHIVAYLDAIRPALDADWNNVVDPITDGMLIVRYLFGMRAAALTSDALGPRAPRSSAQIETYIQSLLP